MFQSLSTLDLFQVNQVQMEQNDAGEVSGKSCECDQVDYLEFECIA